MTHYYFDVREGDEFTADRDGLVFPSRELAWAEAARCVAELGRDQIPAHPEGHRIVIEVRDSNEPVMSVHLMGQTIWGRMVAFKTMSPSTVEIRRLMEAFALVDPAKKSEILDLAEKLSRPLPNNSDGTKH